MSGSDHHDEIDPHYVRTELFDVATERSVPPSPAQLPAVRRATVTAGTTVLEELQAIRELLDNARWWAGLLLVLGGLALAALPGLGAAVGLVGWLLLRG